MPKLYFYYSAMNAGKSTTLLQSNYNYIERGMNTILFLPKILKTTKIKSRIGLEYQSIPFSRFFNFKESLRYKDYHCIFIDEAQFLTKEQVLQLQYVVDEYQIPVLCYGLRTDFKGEPFEGSKYLLSLSDELFEIKTICKCGKKATMNQRINKNGEVIKDGDIIDIGGNEKYISLCRKCFNRNKS